jgi:predicted RNA-binding protein with PIN domain
MSDASSDAVSGDSATAGLVGLPDEVRARVLGLTADVLPAVPRLPAPLRKVADFAPARRARLGAAAMASALESDDEFRERVGAQVVAKLPAPLSDLAAAPRDADPAEVAALAWLIRPEGWEALLADVESRLAERGGGSAVDEAQLERSRSRAEAAERALREARTRHRAELAELKEANASLRRKLGEARTTAKEARTAAEEAEKTAAEARRQAEAAGTAQDKDSRQLRAEVERLETEARSDRRAARSDRDEATVRARLLLDAVIDAATGLRRELALPQVAGAPGDRVEAALAEQGSTRTPSSAGSLGPTSPALLEQYLTMPRARLIVDGYNVSKTAWESSSLEAQRTRLLNGLAPLVARTGVETTVVFDAASSSSRPVVSSPRGVKVRFSPEGVIADDVIRELVAAEPEGRVVVVVTNDQAVARDVVRAGARSASSEALVGLLTRSG